MSTKGRIIKSMLLYIAILALLLLTSPKDMPSVLLMVPFAILLVANYFMSVWLIGLAQRLRLTRRFIRVKSTALLVSGFPVLLLVLQSIGQLTVRDTLTCCVIFVLAYFYMAKASTAISVDH